MADIQVLPITPTAPSGDFAPSKSTEAANGESFGKALDQAQTTVSEKKHSPEKQEKRSVKKTERSSKKPLEHPKKSQKTASKDVPILPTHAEAPVSKAEEIGIIAKTALDAAQSRECDEEIPAIPQISDDQADTPSSELASSYLEWLFKQDIQSDKSISESVVWQTANPDLANLTELADFPIDGQQTAELYSDEPPADNRQTANPEPVELPMGDRQIAKQDLTETQASGQQGVNADNKRELKLRTDRVFPADRAAANEVPIVRGSNKVIPDFVPDDSSQTKTVAASSLPNDRQQTETSEKLTETPDNERQNTENVGGSQRKTHISDEALQTPKPQKAENVAPHIKVIPNSAQGAETVDNGKNSKADGKTRLVEPLPDAKPNQTAVANQRPPQQSSMNMSLDEVKEALPPTITNEVLEEMESDAEFQPRIQKEPAPVIAPRAEPLIIESALPRQNSGEVKADVREIAADKIAANESAAKTKAVPQPDKIPADGAEAKTNTTAVKSAADDQPVVPTVQAEPAHVKALRAPQTAPPVIETALPKANGDEIKAEAIQTGTNEPATRLAEAPVIETETRNAAVKSERAAASNRPEPAPQAAKEPQTAGQTGTAAPMGSERHTGSQSDMAQNQPQNMAEANEIKNALNVKNSQNSDFKAKFDSVLNSSAQNGHAAETKTAFSNTMPTAHAENLFTATNTDLSLAAQSQSGQSGQIGQTSQTSQTGATVPREFLPPHAPMAQLEGSVRWLLRTDKKGAEIQLHPENLGRVTIQLRVEGAEVHARVWATEASTMPLLENHKTFLESSLKEQGLTLSSFDLQHGKNGQQAHSDAQSHHQHFAPPMMESWTGTEFRQELPTQLTTQHADDGRVELYA